MEKEIVVSNGEVNIGTVLRGDFFGVFGLLGGLIGCVTNMFRPQTPPTETDTPERIKNLKQDNLQSMTVLNGGVAIGTNVSGFATRLTVKKGGVATNVKNEFMGELVVENGGIAAGVELGDGGILTIHEGAIVTNIKAGSNASLSFSVAPDTYIQGEVGGTAFEMREGILSRFIVGIGINLSISKGGTASGIILNGGKLTVRKGGKALNVVKVSGEINAEEGAVVTYVSSEKKTVRKRKKGMGLEKSPYYVEKDATVTDLTVSNAQKLIICSGGTAVNTTVEKGGEIIIRAEAIGNGIILNGGKLTVRKGGLAMDVVNIGGEINAEAGGVVAYAPAPVTNNPAKKSEKSASAEKETVKKDKSKKASVKKTEKKGVAKKTEPKKKAKS